MKKTPPKKPQQDRKEYERAVAEVRTLLARAHNAMVDVFVRLRTIEQGYLWKVGGHATFTDFLRAEFPNALGFEKYSNAITAIELYGEAACRRVGVECAHAMIARPFVDDTGKRALLMATIDRHIEEHGVSPGIDRVRQMAQGICPSLVKPTRETKDVLREASAVVEVERLRARVRELEKEVARLNRELKKSAKGTTKHAAAASAN